MTQHLTPSPDTRFIGNCIKKLKLMKSLEFALQETDLEKNMMR
jgi:hypothetical protein